MKPVLSLESRLRTKALACIAQREHSRVELRRKLLAYWAWQVCLDAGSADGAPVPGDAGGADDAVGRPPEDPEARAGEAAPAVDTLLDWLAARDLLSAERFVETRVQARSRRFGNLRIRRELAQHGLALDAEAEHQLRDTEPQRALAIWARRFGQPPVDATERARQTRFLLARGFSADVVSRVIRGPAGDGDADE